VLVFALAFVIINLLVDLSYGPCSTHASGARADSPEA